MCQHPFIAAAAAIKRTNWANDIVSSSLRSSQMNMHMLVYFMHLMRRNRAFRFVEFHFAKYEYSFDLPNFFVLHVI